MNVRQLIFNHQDQVLDMIRTYSKYTTIKASNSSMKSELSNITPSIM